MTGRPAPTPAQQRARMTAVCALAAVAVAPFTALREGTVLHAYWDPVHIATECTGETHNVQWGVKFTTAQCATMLGDDLAHRYAQPIIKCVPELEQHPGPLHASLDAAYNAGPKAFCRSPMALAFNAGRWRAGCAKFVTWYVTARGKRLPGLVTRRRGEEQLCMEGTNR